MESYLDIRILAELPSARKVRATATDYHNVGFGVVEHIGHVTRGHFTVDLGFPDRLECVLVKVGQLESGLVLFIRTQTVASGDFCSSSSNGHDVLPQK